MYVPITKSSPPKLFTGAVIREFRTGQTLFHEGELPNSFYVITQGVISVRKRKGSAYVEIARVHQHEVLGEISFFDREPRSATAVALTDVKALEISFESLEKVYNAVPDYLKAIMSAVANRLRKANEQIRKLQHKLIAPADDDIAAEEVSDEMSAEEALKIIEVDEDKANEPLKPAAEIKKKI